MVDTQVKHMFFSRDAYISHLWQGRVGDIYNINNYVINKHNWLILIDMLLEH